MNKDSSVEEEKIIDNRAKKGIAEDRFNNSKITKKIILLAHTKQGKKYRIENIYGGHCLNLRLNSMGIVPGDIVKVIYQGYGGPMTLAVKGVRIALGRGIAHKIEVSELD